MLISQFFPDSPSKEERGEKGDSNDKEWFVVFGQSFLAGMDTTTGLGHSGFGFNHSGFERPEGVRFIRLGNVRNRGGRGKW